jgi:hypothetical protein
MAVLYHAKKAVELIEIECAPTPIIKVPDAVVSA